jgi:hypothetical protein
LSGVFTDKPCLDNADVFAYLNWAIIEVVPNLFLIRWLFLHYCKNQAKIGFKVQESTPALIYHQAVLSRAASNDRRKKRVGAR